MPELTDADPNTPGFQVDLYDGVNYVSLFVYPTDYCHYGSGYDLAITRAEGSVSLVRPNRPPTGSIAIEPNYTGSTYGPCIGCTLSAVDYSINDRDGLTDATYSYQWLADDVEIAGATSSSYTVASAVEGKAIKVRVSFTDDRGTDETLTSSATADAASNLAITGTAGVGNTLTADTSGIVDADGLVNVSYSYQWIANDGSSDTDIEGATGSSYRVSTADRGKTIKVRVSFTDDAGNDETRTSYPTRVVNLRFGYITGTVTEDTSDPNNVITNFTVTWVDAHVCSTDYNAYLHIVGDAGEVVHLGSATSSGAGITKGLAAVRDNLYWYRVELYCGTDVAGRWVSRVYIPWSENRPPPGTYSSEPPLSGLSVSHGTLSPSFGSYWFSYNVPDVANDVTRTTITATPKSGYFVEIYESSGGWRGSGWSRGGPARPGPNADCQRQAFDSLGPMPELADADPNTPGFQVDLYDGVNYITIFVYPIDYCNPGTGYDLAITRAEGSVSLVRPNRPPTGIIAISPSYYTTHGPCIGCTLSAVDYSINDRDGLTDATYSYQWLADDVEIAGATDDRYTVATADEGKAIKVRVSFTDDRGTDESLTSSATAAADFQPRNHRDGAGRGHADRGHLRHRRRRRTGQRLLQLPVDFQRREF